MKCCYHEGYQAALSPEHPYPMSKYPLLKNRLIEEGVLAETDILQPEPAPIDALARAHTPEYLHKLTANGLSAAEVRRLGLPWSESLWRRSRLAAGGTLLAARTALAEGIAANIAGGTHHAFADHGEGFCVINDVAIAALQLLSERAIRRAVVIDLDVHQGNGTASIFEDDEEVFTFSMHGERNYPIPKMRSNRDVGLADGIGDGGYLDVLASHLPDVLERADADLAFYVAGVDVAAGDRFGKLGLSEAGIRARERMVIGAVRERGLPLVIVPAGGYAASRERTAELHAHAFREAAQYQRTAPAAAVTPPSRPSAY